MQGERWLDAELDIWRQQSLRLLPPPPPPNAPPDPRVARAEEDVFRLERELNGLRFARQRRQRQLAALQEELAELARGEARDRDAGQGAEAQVDRIVTGWRLRRVMAGWIVNTAADRPETILAPKTLAPSILAQARELGMGFAIGLETGIF